jgi:hypothetical protein
MINDFIKMLSIDNHNIDEVYSHFLNEYKPDNIHKTEVSFIDSLLSNIDNDVENEKVIFTSLYLSKKMANVKWYNLDYLKHYKRNGSFFEPILIKKHKNPEYNQVKDKLLNYLETFGFIYFHLPDNDRNIFLTDTKQRVNEFINIQDVEKIKNLYIDFKKSIEQKSEFFEFIIKCKDAIDEFFITSMLTGKNEDGSKNEYYCFGILNKLENHDFDLYQKPEYITIKNISDYRIWKHDLIRTIVNLFIDCYNFTFDKRSLLTEIQSKWISIDKIIYEINSFNNNIQHSIIKKDYHTATSLNSIIIGDIDFIVKCFIDDFLIRIDRTPLIDKLNNFKETQTKYNIDNFARVQLSKDSLVVSKQNTPQQVESVKSDEVKPDINNFILNVNNKKEFLNDLSSEFKTEKGKSIEAIIKILVENKIFNIPNRTKRQFIDLLRNEFKQNIGTYSSINDAEKIKPFDNIFLEPIENKLSPLINKHKAN